VKWKPLKMQVLNFTARKKIKSGGSLLKESFSKLIQISLNTLLLETIPLPERRKLPILVL
jgi:hypothetical protein